MQRLLPNSSDFGNVETSGMCADQNIAVGIKLLLVTVEPPVMDTPGPNMEVLP